MNAIIEERTSQHHGPYLEEAVYLSLELVLLGLSKDSVYSDAWRPVYQVKFKELIH